MPSHASNTTNHPACGSFLTDKQRVKRHPGFLSIQPKRHFCSTKEKREGTEDTKTVKV